MMLYLLFLIQKCYRDHEYQNLNRLNAKYNFYIFFHVFLPIHSKQMNDDAIIIDPIKALLTALIRILLGFAF